MSFFKELGEWFNGSGHSPATKDDLKQMEKRIMATLDERLAAIEAKIDEGTAEVLADVVPGP